VSQGARKTHQKRSQQTRDKLLNALENLLREKDFADISVAEIATCAGVSAASIYRRFDKKEGFIPVLFDLYLKRLEEWGTSAEAQLQIQGRGLRETLRHIVQTGWRQMEQQAHIMRAVHLHGRGHLDLMGEKITTFEDAMLMGMHAVVSIFATEIKRADADKTARMLAYYFNNILIEKGLFGDKGAVFGIKFDDDTFTKEIADFAYGYLTTEG